MKEVAWIYGNSAAGKETLIRNLTEKPEETSDLIEGLGWVAKHIVASLASLEYVSQYDGDPITLKRDYIIPEVVGIIKHADVALVKWQFVDSENKLVDGLKAALPEARHRAIQVVTPDTELAERLPNKSWWDNYYDDIAVHLETEHNYLDRCIAELGDSFPLTKVSGSSQTSYLILDK